MIEIRVECDVCGNCFREYSLIADDCMPNIAKWVMGGHSQHLCGDCSEMTDTLLVNAIIDVMEKKRNEGKVKCQ